MEIRDAKIIELSKILYSSMLSFYDSPFLDGVHFNGKVIFEKQRKFVFEFELKDAKIELVVLRPYRACMRAFIYHPDTLLLEINDYDEQQVHYEFYHRDAYYVYITCTKVPYVCHIPLCHVLYRIHRYESEVRKHLVNCLTQNNKED
jgi:hypothetical protein